MPTDSDELEIVQNLIRFCPLCGHESTKEFNDYIDSGGDWVCVNCNEFVEAYLLSTEEDDEDEAATGGESGSSLYIWILLIVFICIYFFI